MQPRHVTVRSPSSPSDGMNGSGVSGTGIANSTHAFTGRRPVTLRRASSAILLAAALIAGTLAMPATAQAQHHVSVGIGFGYGYGYPGPGVYGQWGPWGPWGPYYGYGWYGPWAPYGWGAPYPYYGYYNYTGFVSSLKIQATNKA